MIFDKIKEIIVDQLEVDADKITMDTNFQKDLEADSLDVFQIVSEIEDSLNVEIDTDEDLATVADLVHYIEQQLNK
ncbi:acyl carrier protein [Ignavigranum ruoffiae]|uniref:Acyl carrier protein n=1 Tax=Ignavigranum ruoffiae TaxID=89093 RepID=A0A1H9AMZ4_9LACT|nr:acyl carrier protein [Ignavigranum ruoffiae]UPQ85768.1 acyl carrier protein [Ignavigranum ruoffiae]SEP77925.1 acyl carrier protein [Ignavigranum ruoffiae]